MTKFIAIILSLITCSALRAQLTFSVDDVDVMSIAPDPKTGLKMVYILREKAGVIAEFHSDAPEVAVSTFGNLGASYSTPVSLTEISPGTFTFPLSADDSGYIIAEGSKFTYYWIISYSKHRSDITALSFSSESDCEVEVLESDGLAPSIRYYSVLGAPMDLSRDYKLSYNTLQLSSDALYYVPALVEFTLSSVNGLIRVPAPLCATAFILSPDRFMSFFGENNVISTPITSPRAVSASVSANIISTIASNELPSQSESTFGGSAPLEIEFSAIVTDAVAFTEWQISSSPDFETIDLRYSDQTITPVFSEEGEFYVRFIASDSSGDCSWESEIFTVSVGSSSLECPNAFSPSSTPGVNDEWKVTYRSIISFECHIFNRWGTQLASLSHPSQGWDGKYKGKIVPSGVYYYVIKATGADGKHYKLSGDINVINSRTSSVK